MTKIERSILWGMLICIVNAIALLIAPILVSARSWVEVVLGVLILILAVYIDFRIAKKIKLIIEG